MRLFWLHLRMVVLVITGVVWPNVSWRYTRHPAAMYWNRDWFAEKSYLESSDACQYIFFLGFRGLEPLFMPKGKSKVSCELWDCNGAVLLQLVAPRIGLVLSRQFFVKNCGGHIKLNHTFYNSFEMLAKMHAGPFNFNTMANSFFGCMKSGQEQVNIPSR